MKRFLRAGIGTLLLSGAFAVQSDAQDENASGSFETMYRHTHPGLIYSYDAAAQVHNYSGNWDFDGDGQKDSVLFRGNGAVHVYYYLDIVLSSGRNTRNFPGLAFDQPFLASVTDLEQSGREGMPALLQFVVHDFDHEGNPDLYLNFNPDFSRPPHAWKKQGIHAGPVILAYKNRHWTVRSYKP